MRISRIMSQRQSSPLLALRSEDVQEIISHVPVWMVRWGLTLIFFIFILILFLSWFIRYPDIIKAQVVITTSPAPLTLVSRSQGNISLLKKEYELVKKGELIGFIQSNVDVDHLLQLEVLLNKEKASRPSVAETNFQLGELQNPLNQLIAAEQDLQSFYSNDLETKQVRQLEKQLINHRRLTSNSLTQLAITESEYALAKEKFTSDSILFGQQVTAKVEYNAAKSIYLQHLRAFRTAEATAINSKLLINQLEKEIEDLLIEKHKAETDLINNLVSRTRELSAQLKKWKENYLFTSPSQGEVAYLGFLENEQFVESGKDLFSIIPKSKEIYGQAELPIVGSGKVKEGQHVNIRLINYPAEQYGMLVGKVESISIVPHRDQYLVKIALPNGMISSYKNELAFKQQLKGEMEVITEDLRLLERVFYQFRRLLRQK